MTMLTVFFFEMYEQNENKLKRVRGRSILKKNIVTLLTAVSAPHVSHVPRFESCL